MQMQKLKSAALSAVLFSTLAFFSNNAEATRIQTFQAAGPQNYIVTQDAYVLEHLKPSVWGIGNYSHNPYVCRDGDGAVIHKIVEHQAQGELVLGLGLFDWVEINGAIPAAYLNGPGAEGVRFPCRDARTDALNDFNLVDPRLGVKVRLTPNTLGFVAALRLETEIPLAQFINPNIANLTGDVFPNVSPAVSLGYRTETFKIGADFGVLLRTPTKLDEIELGPAFRYGAAAELAVYERNVYATLDLYGTANTDWFFSERNVLPFEAVLGAKGYIGDWVMLGGVGTGIVPDIGAADLRLFAGVGYHPRPEPPKVKVAVKEPSDRDGDGILDDDDECPDAPEDFDDFEDEDGCPEIDNDKDGIIDRDDECPNEPEDFDRWQDGDGCPDPDNDEDKILDADDECPNDPEVYNDFEDEDGCPDAAEGEKKIAVIVKRDRIEILEKVYFAVNSDRILPKSYELLDNVAQVLNDHQEIPSISVEGHTDSDGSNDYNLDLSQRRSESVRRYLIDKDVEASRLSAKGFGEEEPIVANDSKENKAKNRRVEFRIVEDENNPSGISGTTGDDDAADEGEDFEIDEDEVDLPEGEDDE